MGTTLSVTTGFGFAVPPEVIVRIEEQLIGDDDYESFYDHLYEILRGEPLLTYEMATFYDYTPAEDGKEAYVVFVKASTTVSYGAKVFRPRLLLSANSDDTDALHCAAEKLGIKNPVFECLTVVSCG